MSGPTQHLPFFSSAETACLEQVHEGLTSHFATVHEFFIHACDDHKRAFRTFHERQNHFNYSEGLWQLKDEYRGILREVAYDSQVTGATSGPDVSSVFEVQHFYLADGAGVMEVRTLTPDVPYGDHFNVVSRWVIREVEGSGLQFTFYAGANFVKHTTWKTKIEEATRKSASHGFMLWIDLLNSLRPDRLSAVKPSNAVLTVFNTQLRANPASLSHMSTTTSATTLSDLESLEDGMFIEDTTPAHVDQPGPANVAAAERDNEPAQMQADIPVPAWADHGNEFMEQADPHSEIAFGRGDLNEEKERAKHELFVGPKKLRTKLARIMPAWKQLIKRSDGEAGAEEPVSVGGLDVIPGRHSDAARSDVEARQQEEDDGKRPSAEAEAAPAAERAEGQEATAAGPTSEEQRVEQAAKPEEEESQEPELYECVFYRRKLGFTLKFYNDVPVVVAVDDVEHQQEHTPRSVLSEVLMNRPARTESETASFVDRHSNAEDQPLEGPVSSPPVEYTDEPVKVAVQCDEVFGEGVKRVWKGCLPLATVNGEVALKDFGDTLRQQYGLDPDKALDIQYLDTDLDQYVQLEPLAWADFMAASKKVIKLQLREVEKAPDECVVPEMDLELPGHLSDMEHTNESAPASPFAVAASHHPPPAGAHEGAAAHAEHPNGIVLEEHGNEMEFRGPEVGSVLLSINGVRLVGLDQDQVIALLTHPSRPLVVEFRASKNEQVLHGARERSAIARLHIQYSTFEKKYQHKLNAATRKTVDRFFTDFNKTNWVKAAQENNGTPGASVISVYRWVEHEMTRVGLFDNSTTQGGGLPEMGEEQWDDVREHIERFIVKGCLSRILESFPGGQDEDTVMRQRLASLRFLKPWHFGLEHPPELVGKHLTGPQWALAMTELCKAMAQTTPTDILRRLKLAVRMIAHAVEALLATVNAEKKRVGKDTNPQEAIAGDALGVGAGHRAAIPARLKQKVKQKSATVVGADDLLPVLTWVLVQANPPQLMQKLWFVSEFKHPDIASLGEESYCLAQVVSAAEFLKNLEPTSLAISARDYELGIARYNLTQRLINTAKGGTLAMCKQLLADGADVNGLTPSMQDCPISVAIKHQHREMVKLFVEQPGVDVNIKLNPYAGNPRMVTPLMLATISGDAAMVLMLLKAGADRYAVDSQGNTAASIAMQAGHIAVVRLLLADPEQISLSEACASGNMNLVEGLLGQGVEINERHEDGQCTPLIAAAYMGHLAVLDKLLNDRRTDVNFTNADGETALMFSAQPSSTATPEQKVAVALRLLEHGANRYLKDAQGRTALSWAERWGYRRLINILKYDPAQLQIYECAKDGNLDAVEALIDQKVDVNTACPTRQFTPLIAAVFNSDLAMIDRLLKCPGIDINAKGRQGMTALHYASQIGNVEVVGRLLAARADRAIQDDRGMLPRDVAERKGFTDVFNMLRFDPRQVSICLAAMHGDWLVIQSLLLQGVSVNTRQKHHSEKGWHHERYTPLIAAVAYNKVEVVKKLLAQPNIDVNLPNLLGQTPLMYAAAKGNERLVLILLRAGANRYLVDRDQRSSLAWAMKHNHLKVAHILSADPARMTVQETIREGNKDLTVALFKQRVDVNSRLAIAEGDPRGALVVDGETPLISAARYGRNELMALIFKSPDVLVDLADASGKTPLIHAAMVGNEEGVVMLLQHGANRQHMDFDRKTATDYALARGHDFIATILKTDPKRVCIHAVCVDGELAVLQALLRQGVSVNARDLRKGTKQETPLIVAAKHNRLDIVDCLLTQPGLEIDATDSDGRTALMVAAAVGALDVTASLLKAGANRHLKDRAGLNADNWAGKFGHINLMRFIAQQIYY